MKKVLFGMAMMIATTFSCSQKAQQAQSDAPADTVSGVIRINCMIEVTPEVRDSVIALSKELVDSSRNDAGNIDYDILESATNPKSLMIFETWKDQASLDKHSASSHFTRIVPQIQKLGTMDVQVFPSVAAQPDAQPVDSILRLNCPHKVSAENNAAAISLMKELVAQSKKEAGCIAYDLFLSMTDPTFSLIFETWADQASLDKHSASEHFKRLVPQIGEKCESTSVEKFKMAKP